MKYKLSNYLVFSQPIITNKYVLLYSTISTTMTLIQLDLYHILMNNNLNEIDNDVLQELVKNKILVSNDFNELDFIIKENKEAIKIDNLLYQVISPSSNCQLGCGYCGQVHTKNGLDENLNKKIIERIAKNLKAKEYKELGISWFGAEPLMGLLNIKKLSKELMELASGNNCSYSAKMITNGLSLKKDIFFDLVENYKVKDFEITLDGTEENHDLRRHTKLKEKTFGLIFKNLKDIVSDAKFDQLKCFIKVRCNVDGSNYKSAFDLIELLDKEKILNKISFYTAPIHSWGNDAHLSSLSQTDYSKFQIEEYLILMKKNHSIGILPGKKTNIVCTSLHENAEVFDADGNVYNCTEISQVDVYKDVEAFKIGKLNGEYNSNTERPFSSWNDDILNGEVPCTTCRILPICGGACPKLWKEGISPCPPIKYNIEDRLLLEFSKRKDEYLQVKDIVGQTLGGSRKT
ncbi:MAG: radical SAM protein [Flavobacterium circumlabens]|uniref:radical SAM/SPASM domain-containing protein n=1 Tax=Flavobacterium circumlabens TaxID=2133765 RepID=UPI003263DE74